MIKSTLKGSALLIALYLVVNNYTGAKALIDSSASGGGSIIKDFQGRS